MYQVLNALKAALSAQLLHIRICTEAGTELDHDTLTYTASCASGTDIAIGSVCAAMIRCKLYGAYDLQDAPITVEVGAEVDGAIQYVPLGRFYVTSQERAEDSTTITAYDAAYYALGGEYVPSGSPATALAVLRDICTQVGLTLDYSGADVAVDGDLTAHTCREMVGYMAALLGCNAVISRSGQLALRWYTDNGQNITPDDYYSGGLSLAGETTIVGVRMTKTVKVRTTGTDGTITEVDQTTNYDAGEGSGTVIAVDNPFATQDIVDAVWEKIGGLGTFRAGSCSVFGGLLTEPGDLISVTGMSGLTSVLPAMSLQLELDGGCRCTVTASGQSQTEADAQVVGPTGKALKKVQADIAQFKELTAQNLTATNARITNIWANDITLSNLLHSEDYVRSDAASFADSGLGIDFSTKEIVSTDFLIRNGKLYAQGGQIAGFNLAKVNTRSIVPTTSSISYLDVDGAASSDYSVNSSTRILTAGEDGTACYQVPVQTTYIGETYPLSKLFCRPKQTIEPEGDVEPRLGARVVYVGSSGDIHTSEWTNLQYMPAASTRGWAFTLDQTWLSQATSIRLEVDLSEGDTCYIQEWFGSWQALYYGNSNQLMGDPEGVYIGTDGISVGEDIALTPDGHATVEELTAKGSVSVGGDVNITGGGGIRTTWQIVENESNSGRIMIRDTGSVARQIMWINASNVFNVGTDNASIATLIRGGGGITLNNSVAAKGDVNVTGGIRTTWQIVENESNSGRIMIRDTGNVARQIMWINASNVFNLGTDTSTIATIIRGGGGITLNNTTSVNGNLSATGQVNAGSSVNATTGVSTGNNYGLYCKTTSGTLVKIAYMGNTNVVGLGNDSYDTIIYGKTIKSTKTITTTSDRRLKRDITVLDSRHEALFDRLCPVRYLLREDEDGKEHIGLVAQEVQEALEQSGLTNSALVQADSEGMLSIGYGELIGLLVDEVQTLKRQMMALRGEMQYV